MEEAPENGKESSHSAYANGMECMYIYIYIQGVTGGTDQTSGECSLC